MKKTETKIAVLGIVVLFAVLTVSTASAHVFMKYKPLETSVPEGECHSAYVEVWANVSGDDDLKWGQIGFRYDPSCVNVTDHEWGPWVDPSMTSWNANPDCWGPGIDWVLFTFALPVGSTMVGDEAMLVNLTVHCESSEYCETPLELSCGEPGCVVPCQLKLRKSDGTPVSGYTLVNGTFKCGEAPQPETFTKSLAKGWNLISLPLTADDMTVSSVFSSVSGKYDAIYSYDATTHSWVALGDDDTLENGVGYFIHMTESGTWTYNGSAYTTMNISLEPGLNMVGWLNCSKPIDDALSSIEGNYRYVARWNSTAHKFEVYVPGAPSEFNDFNTMERGEGYFISMKTSDTLTASC